MAKLFIQAWAKAKGTNLSKLAVDINMSQPNMSLIGSGKSWPKEETLDKIANTLGIEVYQLFLDPSNVEGKRGNMVCPHCGKPIEINISPAE